MEVEEARERREARRKAYSRDYYLKNKSKIIERAKLRYKNNRTEILNRYNTDETFRKKSIQNSNKYSKNRKKSDETYRKRLNDMSQKSHKKRSMEIKEEIIKRLGSRCQICGFDNPLAFELHHINGRNSRPDPNKRDPYKYYLNLLNTINDIQLLCANCHRIIHKEGLIPRVLL